MIKRIFQDLNECVVFNNLSNHVQDSVKLQLNSKMNHICIRPCASKLFEMYCSIVGKHNVFILTSSDFKYAKAVKDLANFKISDDQIVSRQDILKHHSKYCDPVPKHKFGHKNNVLIDNNKYSNTSPKIAMMGIVENNYLKTPEYSGKNANDEVFYKAIVNFIISRTK